jgi:hypothetical protein
MSHKKNRFISMRLPRFARNDINHITFEKGPKLTLYNTCGLFKIENRSGKVKEQNHDTCAIIFLEGTINTF